MRTVNSRVNSSIRLMLLLAILWICSSKAFATQIDTTAVVAGASFVSQQVSTQEWLGPLSAIALSPFFGLACLSGAATYGPEWLQSRSHLIDSHSPLNNPMLFWTVLGLTIATSLPRFTKVSKPIALAAEKLEMYSTVIILVVMRFFAATGELESPAVTLFLESSSNNVAMTAGIASLPLDVILCIAAAINIVVVNTIKLSIEFLVWLIPVPTIDACLEVANKSIATALMALYMFSPFLSTVLNLIIFGLCCLVFLRVQRRIRYAKDLIMMPLLEKFFSIEQPSKNKFVGFLMSSWNGIPVRSAFQLERISVAEGADDLTITQFGWFKNRVFRGRFVDSESKAGLLTDEITLQIESQKVVFAVRKGFSSAPVVTAFG